MKYITPIYRNEKIETSDIICESPFDIVYTTTVVGKDSQGNDIVAPTTQIVVDMGSLL